MKEYEDLVKYYEELKAKGLEFQEIKFLVLLKERGILKSMEKNESEYEDFLNKMEQL